MNFSTSQELPNKQTSRGQRTKLSRTKCKQKVFKRKNQLEESCTEEEDYYAIELPTEESKKRERKGNSAAETRRTVKGYDSPQVFPPANEEPKTIARQTYCVDVRTCQTGSNRKSGIERVYSSPMSYVPHPQILRELMNTPNSTTEPKRHNQNVVNQTFDHPIKLKGRNDDRDLFCQHHRHRDHGQENLLDQRKNQMKPKYGPVGNSTRFSKTTLEMEDLSKNSTDTTTGTGTTTTGTVATTTTIATTATEASNSFKKFPSSSRRYETGQGQNFSNSSVSNNFEAEKDRKKTPRPTETEKEIVVHDSFLLTNSFQKQQKPSKTGKVREKLVYVVEEEGKDVKKLETELFTVNEILTIKKDLLELSEFARKLKKLKELKKEPEKGVTVNDPCQCRPVSEVLNEVSKRMEALEARQEQLEKEKRKSKKKRNSEKVSKRLGDSKTKPTSIDQNDDGCHPNFIPNDMDLSKMENLPHGSEIVTELMDLKSQLHKLEKTRMPSDLPTLSDSSPKKKKGHAIAVFSSKTYILAPPGQPSGGQETGAAYEEKREKKKNVGHSVAALSQDREDMVNKCIILDANNPRKMKIETEKTKNDVVNWLNNIPTAEKNQPRNSTDMKEDVSQRNAGGLFICNKCAQILTDEEIKNQGPTKNPTTEKNLVEKEVSPKNGSPPTQEISKPYECGKCYMTPSGDFYTVEHIKAGVCSKNFEKESNWKRPSCQIVSQSSGSTPTAILAKEYLEMVNKKDKITNRLREADFLEFASNPEKVVKTFRNTKTKSLYQISSPCPGDKKIKESKNEMVKKQSEGENMEKEEKRDLVVLNTTSQSEFVAAVDLDKESSNEKRRRQKSSHNIPQIFVVRPRSLQFPECTLVDRKCCKRKKDKKRKKRKTDCYPRPCKRERRRCCVLESTKKCRRKCTRPTCTYISDGLKKKRKCCHQNEKPRKQYCREKKKVEKCRERNGQEEGKPERYGQDYHFKPPTVCRSRQFRKRLQPCRDNEDPCQKPETTVNCSTEKDKNKKSDENVCHLRKFFRDMKGFLPSFSDWNFFSYDKPKKKDSCSLAPEQDKDACDQKERPLQVYYVQTAKVDPQKSCREGEPEHLKKCKCIRQFLKAQDPRQTRDWPGSRPFPSTSEPSTTTGLSSSECSSSTYGYESVKRPDIYYVDRVPSVKECKASIKCEKKKLKEKLKDCKRRAKKEKCERKERRKRERRCVCNICGNVHKRKRNKRGRTCEEKYGKRPERYPTVCPKISPDTSAECCCKPKPQECKECEKEDDCSKDEEDLSEEEQTEEDCEENETEDECEEAKECQGQPFFSIFKGNGSSPKQKEKKSLSSKFKDLRYLKTCSSTKTATSGDSTYSEKPKKKIRYKRSPTPPRYPDKCRSRKKREKSPSKKNPCPKGGSSSSGVDKACHCQPILEEIEHRLKCLESRLKRKKKKMKEKDKCSSSCDADKYSPAYYCVYPQLSRGPEGDAGLQLDTEDNRFFIDSKHQSSDGSRTWKKALKPKISSLYSFWKYISRHGKGKDGKIKVNVVVPNDGLLDDFTAVPQVASIHSIKPEPERKIKTKEKIKNLMKSKRPMKDKEKTDRRR